MGPDEKQHRDARQVASRHREDVRGDIVEVEARIL